MVTHINFVFAGALLAVFVLLFISRVFRYTQVFRDGIITLPGNDPYFYRYLVDQLLAASPDPFSPVEIAEALGGGSSGEPLVATIGYWATLLVEETPTTTEGVAIGWIPVGAALIVGSLVAWMAHAVTEDDRVVVLSVAALALTPAHALYAGIGFFDHHAIDYVWVAGMAATLIWLARDVEQRMIANTAAPVYDHLRAVSTWIIAGCFGLTIVAAVFSWNGSPVLLTGVAAYVFFKTGSDVRAGVSPVGTALPVAGGLAFATGVSHWLHATAGWQEPAVAYSPALVLGGLIVVTLFGTITARVSEISVRAYLVATIVGTTGFVGFIQAQYPAVVNRLLQRGDIVVTGREIAESRRLITADYGVFFGSVDMFGWFLFIGLPALLYVSWQCIRAHEPRWLVLCGFAWPLLGFTFFEIRFSGELSPFMSIFTALGAVVLLQTIDAAKPISVLNNRSPQQLTTASFQPTQETVYIALTLLLVASLSLFMIPAITGNVAQTDAQVEAIEWMQTDAAGADRPEFVLSKWGRQRLYNYHVFDRGRSYSVGAQEDMVSLLSSTDPDAEYSRFAEGVGYLVLEPLQGPETTSKQGYERLINHYGSANGSVDGVGHYRVTFVASDESRLVFVPVKGATISGTGPANQQLEVETDVRVPGKSFTYTRYAVTNETGMFSVRVAHPGTYRVGNQSVIITNSDVRKGKTVRLAN
jgi:dolichyl-diphosphooligosaccharide--protein glycosyltransferase